MTLLSRKCEHLPLMGPIRICLEIQLSFVIPLISYLNLPVIRLTFLRQCPLLFCRRPHFVHS